MAKTNRASFNFGANRKTRTSKGKKPKAKKGKKSNAWRAYTGGK